MRKYIKPQLITTVHMPAVPAVLTALASAAAVGALTGLATELMGDDRGREITLRHTKQTYLNEVTE